MHFCRFSSKNLEKNLKISGRPWTKKQIYFSNSSWFRSTLRKIWSGGYQQKPVFLFPPENIEYRPIQRHIGQNIGFTFNHPAYATKYADHNQWKENTIWWSTNPCHFKKQLSQENTPLSNGKIARYYFTKAHSLSHTAFFTDRSFYTKTIFSQTFYTQTVLHTDFFTHRRFYTQKLLHTDFFTQNLLHTRFHTQTLSPTEALTIEPHFVRRGWADHIVA